MGIPQETDHLLPLALVTSWNEELMEIHMSHVPVCMVIAAVILQLLQEQSLMQKILFYTPYCFFLESLMLLLGAFISKHGLCSDSLHVQDLLKSVP